MESKMESKTESKKKFSWVACCAGMAEEPVAKIVKAAEEIVEKAGVGDVTVKDILEKIDEIIPTSDVAKETSAEASAEASAETTVQAPQTTSV